MSKMYQIAEAVFFDFTRGNRLKCIVSLFIFISCSVNKRHFAFAKHRSVVTSIVFFFATTKK